jgi:hypothetical protein
VLVGNVACLSLLREGDLSFLPAVQESVEGTLQSDGASQSDVDLFKEHLGVHTVVNNMLGPELNKLVHW